MTEQELKVWRYGARKGVAIPSEVEEQLRLGNELREHLVQLVYMREGQVRQVWADQPQVAHAQHALDVAHVRLDELLQQAASERMRARSREIPPELEQQITVARSARRDASARAREAKETAYSAAAPALHAARDQERRERKAAYATFVQQRGLYWATFNNIARKHDVADRRVASLRKQGRPAQLRHHRHNGTGRLAVQLQREKGKPERTPRLLCTTRSPWWGVLRIPEVATTDPEQWGLLSRSEQRKAGRAHIAVRIGSREDRSPILWEIPVQIHRPTPPGAEVLAAEVVITRVASQRRVSVNLTIRMPSAAPVKGGAVAVDIGWRAMPDGSIRVAYWRASGPGREPITVPDHLAGVLHVNAGGNEGEVTIPASWRRLDERIAQIRSGRDKDLQRMTRLTANWLRERPGVGAALQVTPALVMGWQSPARMVRLARRLSAIDSAEQITGQLYVWERQDRHLWQWEANEREQLALRRRDAYRATAARLVRAWPHPVLETRFVASVIRRPVDEHVDEYQAEHARRQARLAAPAGFADALRKAAASGGGTVVELDPQLTTRRHHMCGEPLPDQIDTAIVAIVECPRCGVSFDQDQNAVVNMLREASRGTRDVPDGLHRTNEASQPEPPAAPTGDR